jgi:hypothetical protein
VDRKYWLKSIGSSNDLQADDWPESAPQELSFVHFPDKGKPSVRPGDYLVYYATGQKRIVGIAEIFTSPTKDSPEPRWPWRCEVRPRIIISRIHRSPLLDEVSDEERNFRISIRQQSHVEINEEQYVRARTAMESVFDDALGDRFYPWPMFETALVSKR